MEVVVCSSPEETARRAAVAVLERVPSGGERAPVIGLATGSSPLGLYRELGLAVARDEASFSGAYGFALDEYVGLPPGHPEGYRQVLLREVCGVIGLAPERLAVPDGSGRDVPTLMAAAAAYEARIRGSAGWTSRCSASGPTAIWASTNRGRR